MLNDLLLTGYELLSALLPFSALFWGYARLRRKKGAPLCGTETAAMLLFGGYVAAALCLAGAGTLFDLLRSGSAPGNALSASPARLAGWALNALLLVPFGAMLPFLCKKMEKWQNIFLAGLAFSLLMELSRFPGRSAGTGGLVLNVLGALAGYGLFLLVRRLAGERQAPARRGQRELLLACAVLFAGHFFLFDGPGAAGLLSGF